jgi:hypothetical protein
LCFTDEKVEIVTINGNIVTINEKDYDFDFIKVSKKNPKNEIETMVIGGTSYIEIPNPGGSWSYNDDYWIDVYAGNNWITFTVAAIAAIIGFFVSGIPGSVAAAFGGWLVASALAPYTSVAQIHGYKYASTSFFKTYNYTYKLYAESEFVKVVVANHL